jgi:hypothetical protein
MGKPLIEVFVDHHRVVQDQIPIYQRGGFAIGIQLGEFLVDLVWGDVEQLTVDILLV